MTTNPVLSLDLMRDMMLNANDRHHRMALADRRKRLRVLAGWHAKAWRQRHKMDGPLPYRVRAEATLSFPMPRHRDQANYQALLKPLVDGVVDAGVLRGDDTRYLFGPDIRFSEDRCRDPFACHIDLELHRA